MLSSLQQYTIVDNNRQSQLQLFERTNPLYLRNAEHFRANAQSIKTVDDLLNDYQSLQVVLSGFQLEEEINKRAFLKQIMTESPSDPESLANRLVDPRYRELATAMQPLAQGADPFASQEFADAILARFQTNEFEKSQGQQNPAVREALYFERNIGSINSVTELMGDRTLLKVARATLGLPESFQALDFDQQRDRLERSINIDDFKDEKKLDKFVERFLVLNDLNNPQGPTDPTLQLFGAGGAGGSANGILNAAFGGGAGGGNSILNLVV
jgi:hypothetical protein